MVAPRALVVLLTAAAALTGCADSGERSSAQSHDFAAASDALTGTRSENLQTDTIGPIAFSFDRNALIETEIEMTLPPLHDDTVFAIKLVPRDAVTQPASAQCAYAPSDQRKACPADEEVGLTLALLERPLSDYRRAFRLADVEPSAITGAQLDGKNGFSYRESDGEGVVEYSFIPQDMRTLVIVQRSNSDRASDALAMQRVIGSLRLDS